MGSVVKDGITLEYSGAQGTSSATLSAETNEGIDRSVEFEFATTVGEVSESVSVTQLGRREPFVYADGGELPIYVLKAE